LLSEGVLISTAQSERPRSPTARTSYLSNYDRTPIISSHQSSVRRCKTAREIYESANRKKCLTMNAQV